MGVNFILQGAEEDISRIEKGTKILQEEWNVESQKKGTVFSDIKVNVSFHEGMELEIKQVNEDVEICCHEPAHFFRALNWVQKHLKDTEGKSEKRETAYFTGNGLMLDCSRNAVFTVEKVKEMIRTLAKMGLNRLLLYTEDTYEVADLPYFGAYRGRYTKEEIQEMDTYAQIFGIELIPCIQTLAHLHNALKWPSAEEIVDTPDILQVGKEESYVFIEKLLTAVKDSFHTRRVHLGMDEAVQLGLGNYLKENGYRNSSELIKEHCTRVLEICKKLGLEPMIWSDMYITSNTGKSYYEVPEDADCSDWKKPDPELGLVYWDYYNKDESVYEKMLKVHKQLSDKIVFAGGCWIWNGIAPNYSRSFTCTKSALSACKKYKVPEVFCTAWLDNGAETPVDAILPGAALFAHLGFHQEFDEATLEEEFRDAVGSSLKEFLKLDKFDRLFLGDQVNMASENPSKYLLYQDAMLGIFDYHLKNAGASEYYKMLAEELKNSAEICKNHTGFFEYYHCLAEILSQKSELSVQIKVAYDAQDLSTLRQLCEEIIPHLTEKLWKLKELREDLWMTDAKPFGYELIDLRMGGVITRLESSRRRLLKYVEGRIDKLEELETERIPYFAEGKPAIENHWQRTVSGADFTDTI